MENQEKIGSLLKKARETKKLTIEEVAAKTKINLSMLKHLEANALDKLPNKTYVKGFVRNYAKIVGIPELDAAEALNNTYGETKHIEVKSDLILEEAESQTKPEHFEAQEKLINLVRSLFNKKVIVSVVVIIILIFIIKGIVSFFSQISSEQVNYNTKKEEISQSLAEEESPAANSEVEITEDGTIKDEKANLLEMEASKKLREEKLAEDKLAAEAAQADKIKQDELEAQRIIDEEKAEKLKEKQEEAKKKTITKNLNGKYPYVSFYSAPNELYEVLENAPENKDEELLPSRFRNAIEDGQQNIFIHSTEGDTWISYQADDEEIKRFVLKKGRSVLVKGKVILLFLGNINVAKIFLNNKLIKTYSKTGVKSLIFPESEASNYQLPLFPSYKGIPMKASEYKENMAEKE